MPVSSRLNPRRLALIALSIPLVLTACGDDGTSPAVSSTGGDAALPASDGGTSDLGVARSDMTSPPAEEVALTLDFPVEGQWVNSPQITVRGTYTGMPESIFVNGIAATFEAGAFHTNISLGSGNETVTVLAGTVSVTVNVRVDTVPPDITVDSPPRGTWSESASQPMQFQVTDGNGLTGVFLNERRLPGGGPTFNVDAPLANGLNLLTVRADDLAGNVAHDSQAVISGPTRDPGQLLGGAFRAHLGPRALLGISAQAAAYVDGLDLNALLPAEPINAAGFLIEFADVRHAHLTTVTLAPEPFQLRAQLHVEAVEVDIVVTINETPYPITIHAAGIDVTGILSPGVVDGEIRTGLTDLSLELVDFGVDLTGVPSFGAEPGEEENLLEQFAEEAARNLANEIVPGLLDGALAEFDKVFETTVLGVGFRITVVPEELLVREDGLSVRAGAGVELISPPAPMPGAPTAPGYVGRISGWDGVPDGDDLSIAVDDDLVNLFLFQFWRSGAALPVIDAAFLAERPVIAAQLASVAGLLSATAFPELAADTPLAITTRFALPPVVRIVPADSGAGLVIGVGDLGLDIDTDDAQHRRLIDGAASMLIEGSVSVGANAEGAQVFNVAVQDSSTVFDVLNAGVGGEVETAVEGPITGMLGVAGALLPALVSGIPLPSLGAGFVPISGVAVRIEPNASDFLRVDAQIGAGN